MQSRAGPEVHIEHQLRPVMGRTLVEYLGQQGHRVLACAVTRAHAHVLAELPAAKAAVRQVIGHAKRISSRAVKHALPGSVWSHAGHYLPIRDAQHLRNTHDYIIFGQGQSGWTWSYRDRDTTGVFGRMRPLGNLRRAALRFAPP
jgi:hypothetical protein